jgi:hypothetical protein
MKTSLHFEAPSDLSVGTVRITCEGQEIADWVATPDNRTFQQDNLKPGIYSAEIGPAGVAPQSVLFEIREGQANTVMLPTFSALSSSGSNTSYFDVGTQRAVSDIPESIKVEIITQPLGLSPDRKQPLGLYTGANFGPEPPRPIDVSPVRRRITIALSEEARGREAFDTFRGKSKMELLSGRLEIEIPTDPARDQWAGHRVRLSAAIENVRVERCLLPLYKGGTRITIAAPAPAPADIEFSIVPVDPKLRALVRTLDAGTSAEAKAVRDDVLGKEDPSILLAESADPWAAILVGLLAIRFPDVFHPIDTNWAEALVERAGWAFDTHVIRASQALSAASSSSREVQANAVARAVAHLANAQVAGSPYYRCTNQLFAELAGGVASYLKTNIKGVDEGATRKFDRLYSRWSRELPLQRGAGSTFTWLARDQVALKERNVLVPYRNPSGRLRGRDSTIIFEGQVGAGQIAIISAGPNVFPPSLWSKHSSLSMPNEEPGGDVPRFALSRIPALQRPSGPKNDPNKGRFGGQSSRDGFRLISAFERTSSPNWVTITLTVEAYSSAKLGLGLGDFVWFALHPTFSPPVLKVSFRGNRARLRVQAFGGFTVGVWVPAVGVELESDLALLPDAPRIIQTR